MKSGRNPGGLRVPTVALLAAMAIVAAACGGGLDFEAERAERNEATEQAFTDALDRLTDRDDEIDDEATDDDTDDETTDEVVADESPQTTPVASADVTDRAFCDASAEVYAASAAFDVLPVEGSRYRVFGASVDLSIAAENAVLAAPNAEQAGPPEALLATWLSIRSELEQTHGYNWDSYAAAEPTDGGDVALYAEIVTEALPSFLRDECGIEVETDATIAARADALLTTWSETPDWLAVTDPNELAELQLPYPWEIDSGIDETNAWVHAAPVLGAAEQSWAVDGVFVTMIPVEAGVQGANWMEAIIASSAAANDCDFVDVFAGASRRAERFACSETSSAPNAVVIAQFDDNGVGVLLEGQWDDSQLDGGDESMIEHILDTTTWLIEASDFGPVAGSREAAIVGFGGPGSVYWDLEPEGTASEFCDASIAAWIMISGFDNANLADAAVLEEAMRNIDLSLQNAILRAPDRDAALPVYIMGDAFSKMRQITRDDYRWDWPAAIADGELLDAGAEPEVTAAFELRESGRAFAAVLEQLDEFLGSVCDQPTEQLSAAGVSIAESWDSDFGGKALVDTPSSSGSEPVVVSSSDGRVSVAVPGDWQSDEQAGDRQFSWLLSRDIEALSTAQTVDGVRFVFVEELDSLDGWLDFSRTGHAQITRGCVEQDDASVAEGDVLRTTILYDCDGATALVVSLFDARAPSGLLIQVQADATRSEAESLDWIDSILASVVWDAPTG